MVNTLDKQLKSQLKRIKKLNSQKACVMALREYNDIVREHPEMLIQRDVRLLGLLHSRRRETQPKP